MSVPLKASGPARDEREQRRVDALGERRQRVARQLGSLDPSRARRLHLRVEVVGLRRVGRVGGRQQRLELGDRRFAIGHLALQRRLIAVLEALEEQIAGGAESFQIASDLLFLTGPIVFHSTCSCLMRDAACSHSVDSASCSLRRRALPCA